MSTSPLHLSDHTRGLEPSAFHTQLRRLESLQTLMVQGGTVVSEVAQFLAKAREELNAFQREQETYAVAQQRLVEEKAELSLKMNAMTKAAEEAAFRNRENEERIAQLTEELTSRERLATRQAVELERKKNAEHLAVAEEKIASLERTLQRERDLREKSVGKIRQDEAVSYGTEIARLKTRLTALEQQLETERDRRVRLMEVVKVHDVTVNNQKQRESV